jgi:hypothetical protein
MSIFGSPAFQKNSSATANGATVLSAPAVNTVAGDLIVVQLFHNDITIPAPPTVTDTAGNTYFALTSQTSSFHRVQLFYCIGALPNASNVIAGNATFNIANRSFGITVWDATVSGAAAFDTQTGTFSNSTPTSITTPSFSTASSDDIVFVGVGLTTTGASNTTFTAGYTLDMTSYAAFNGGAAHRSFTSPQSGITVTASFASSFTASIVLAAFKPASGVTRELLLLGVGQ